MEITISSRNIELSDSLVSTTHEKLGRLSRLGRLDSAEVHFYEERNPRIANREVCEVLLGGFGQRVRCKATASDGFIALDRAVSKLEHQLLKLKSRSAIR